MSGPLPALLVIAPLLCAFMVSLAGWLRPRLCFPLAVLGLTGAALSACGLLAQVLAHGTLLYRLGGWPPPIGIVYVVDHLNAIVLVVVSLVALVNLVATRRAVMEEVTDKLGAFYTLFLLAVTGLLGMVVTGDAFNLYVLLEIASLTGYALIGMGPGRAPLSSLNYVLLGTIGASFYLLGVGYIYIMTGTLNMADIARLLPPLHGSTAIMAAFGIMLTGLFIKMAFFPLHGWLPNAYSQAPSAAGSLLAPLMTKVMVYVMIRVMLTVFTPQYVFNVLQIKPLLVWLAVAAIVFGVLMALAQKDLKRILTYIIVAEVGYMVGGAWLGTRLGLTGAILHLVNDAVMTLCVFLAAGNIFYKIRGLHISDLQGLFKKMPWTMGGLVMGAMAIIGVPPTCGFFSKWYLIRAGLEAGHYGYVGALIFASLISVVIFFRIFEVAFFEPFPDNHGGGHHGAGHGHAVAMEEAPASMVAPLILVALGLVFLGLITSQLVTQVIDRAIPAGVL